MIQKDYDRAQRLNEVYKHLFAHHGITSQKAMAEHLGMQRTGLSAAMNGSKANLTDSLFKKNLCFMAWCVCSRLSSHRRRQSLNT